MTALSFRCFSLPPRIVFSIILPVTEVRLPGLEFPGSSFLLFGKTGTSASFQSTGTYLGSQVHLRIIERVLTMTSASSFEYSQMNSTGPYKCTGNWELIIVTATAFQLRALGPLNPSLALRTEAKKALNISAMSLLVRWLSSSCNSTMLFLLCLLLLMYKPPSFYCPPQLWLVSTAVDLQHDRFSPCSGEQHLGIPPTSPDLASAEPAPSFFASTSQ